MTPDESPPSPLEEVTAMVQRTVEATTQALSLLRERIEHLEERIHAIETDRTHP